jgi:hypothetical protein
MRLGTAAARVEGELTSFDGDKEGRFSVAGTCVAVLETVGKLTEHVDLLEYMHRTTQALRLWSDCVLLLPLK